MTNHQSPISIYNNRLDNTNQIVTNNDNYSSDDDTLTPIIFQRRRHPRHYDDNDCRNNDTDDNANDQEREENNPFISLQRFLDSNQDDENDEHNDVDNSVHYRMSNSNNCSNEQEIKETKEENKSFETRNSYDYGITRNNLMSHKSMHYDRHSTAVMNSQMKESTYSNSKKHNDSNRNNHNNNSCSSSNNYEMIQMKRLKQQGQQQKQRRQRIQKQQQKSSNTSLTTTADNKITFGKIKSIQHHYDIRDNFSSSSANGVMSITTSSASIISSRPTTHSTSKQQPNKEGMKLYNATNTSSLILRSSKNTTPLSASTSTSLLPTNHKLHKSTLLDNSSFLLHNNKNKKDMSLSSSLSSDTTPASMWPRWKKERKHNDIVNNNLDNNDTSLENGNDDTEANTNNTNETSNAYLFGPQFLSNRKRKHNKINKNDDVITIVDANDSQLSSSCCITTTPRRNNNNNQCKIPSSTGSEYYYNGVYSNSPYLKSKRHRSSIYTNTSATSTTRRRRKKVPGVLSKLLQTIRKSVESDLVRLQSSHYLQHHYHRDGGEVRGSSHSGTGVGTLTSSHNTHNIMDFNNPRNRAETIVDVTIIGGNFVPLATGSNKVIVLGHIHTFIQKNNNNATAIIDKTRFSTNSWLCFNPETMKEHGIQSGRQLRIYDSMLLVNYDGISLPLWRLPVLLCSSLCESCPKQLSIV